MRLEYLVILSLGIMISSILVLIVNQSSEIPYWNYLNEIKQQEFEDGCDINCKIDQQSRRNYLCVPLDSDQYICRPPREIFYPEDDVQIKTAFPPTFGEFAYFPEGKEITEKNRLFDITKTTLVDMDTKQVEVEFGYHNANYLEENFQYSVLILPGDTFVSHCLGGDSKTAHIVEYLDVLTLDEKTYLEFWGTHVTLPDELLPCKMPDLIQNSLPIDLSLGIDFEE